MTLMADSGAIYVLSDPRDRHHSSPRSITCFAFAWAAVRYFDFSRASRRADLAWSPSILKI
jgi:hypothetical protein